MKKVNARESTVIERLMRKAFLAGWEKSAIYHEQHGFAEFMGSPVMEMDKVDDAYYCFLGDFKFHMALDDDDC